MNWCTKFSTATLMIGSLFLTTALAQDDVRKRGEQACRADAQHCKKFFGQGDGAILACLQERKLQLTPPCRKFLTEVGQLN